MPAAAQPSQPDALSATAVARRLGVAVDTLRTWDRRYGIGPSARIGGDRRRYTAADLQRLRDMRAMVAEGTPPSIAAAAVNRACADPMSSVRADRPSAPGAAGRSGGGRTLAVPSGTPGQRGLARAASALDVDTVERLLSRSIDRSGAAHTWNALLRPVLAAVGRRWAATGDGVEIEHLLSQAAVDALREATRARQMSTGVPMLLACVEGEAHTLPLYALAAVLAEYGVPARVIGASTPTRALRAAAERIGASAVFLSCQVAQQAPDPADLEGVKSTRPPRRLVVGGPGWDPETVRGRAEVASTLDEAVALLTGGIGPAALD